MAFAQTAHSLRRFAFYLPPTAFRLLLSAFRLPLAAFRLLLSACRMPTTANHFLPTGFRLPPTAYRLLLSAFCLLPAAFCLPLSAFCQQPPAVSAPGEQVSKQASDLILQGFDLLSRHDAAGAEKTFRQAIEVQPEVEAAHRGLGLALREEGRLPDAFRELQTATQLNPSDSDAHYTLGSVAWAISLPASAPPGKQGGLSSSDYQSIAGAEFSKALALSPKDPMLRMNLAILYLDSNRPNDAIQQAEEAASRLIKQAPMSFWDAVISPAVKRRRRRRNTRRRPS